MRFTNRLHLCLFLFLFLSAEIVSAQGFYDGNKVFISRNNIIENKVCSLQASSDDPDSSLHPLNNFVFALSFDNAGYLTSKSYWLLTPMDKQSHILGITLRKDTGIYYQPEKAIGYSPVQVSSPVKFDQNKERTTAYMNNFYTKISRTLHRVRSHSVYFEHNIGSNYEYLTDTVLLRQKLSMPYDLLPFGDSIAISADSIITYRKSGSAMKRMYCYFLTDYNTLKIKEFDDENTLAHIYTFSTYGFLSEETQGIYRDLYYFNEKGLHVRTETYQGPVLTSRTDFSYPEGCR